MVVSFEALEKALSNNLKNNKYEVRGGNVQYGVISKEYQNELFCSGSPDNLFIKHPYFSHQKEYRIYCAQSVHNEDFKVLELNDDISNDCKIYSTDQLKEYEDFLVLTVSNLK